MAERTKKIPTRSCIVCRKQFPKDSLLRVVAVDGSLRFDLGGRAPGRGAYICSAECWAKPGMAGRLSSALKTSVGNDAIEELTGQLQAGLARFPE